MSLRRKALQKGYKPQKQKDIILILTNGKNTEKKYFKSITAHFNSIYTIQVKFAQGDALHLVQDAIAERNNNKQLNQVWCAFDIDDSFIEGKIVEALSLAERERIRIAYSNEAFEVWLLFHHLKYADIGQIHRNEYKKKMNALLKDFRQKDFYSKDLSLAHIITDKFIPHIKTAVQNAKISYERKLADHYNENGQQIKPHVWQWLTTSTVYQLVEELRLVEKKASD